ncbi:hypothetical protein [Schleiferia thermophila]|uniref:hypothetical protein n=1 Tax=Schleiferia thermophila TaxID=884107 RepID=UPI0012691F47|nr:hypothetical protein [Schleiferia thermophila]
MNTYEINLHHFTLGLRLYPISIRPVGNSDTVLMESSTVNKNPISTKNLYSNPILLIPHHQTVFDVQRGVVSQITWPIQKVLITRV